MPAQFEVERAAAPPVWREATSYPGTPKSRVNPQDVDSDPLARSSLQAFSNAIQASQYESQNPTFSSHSAFFPKHSAFPLKRLIDLIAASAILIWLLPVLALCYLAVLLTSSNPVFFSHRRIGRGGSEFFVWKFRTMCPHPDQVLQAYLEQHPECRDEWMQTQKLVNDPRVTPIGRFMRRLSLDELPQLWNVIKGDMSLVGPRPIVRSEVDRYGDAIGAYCAVRPGMTGLWQVSGRSKTTYTERVRLDRQYSEEWSPSMELAILLSTFRVVITGDGAY